MYVNYKFLLFQYRQCCNTLTLLTKDVNSSENAMKILIQNFTTNLLTHNPFLTARLFVYFGLNDMILISLIIL